MRQKPVKPSLLVRAEKIHNPRIGSLPLLGGRPCLDFINTVDWRLDPKRRCDTLGDYSALLHFAHRLGLIDNQEFLDLGHLARKQPYATSEAFRRARDIRDAITLVVSSLGSCPQEAEAPTILQALDQFNSTCARARKAERFSWIEGKLSLVNDHSPEGLDQPWLSLVHDADELLRSPLASRIRVCANKDCGWVFLDRSKNGSRRWCSMRRCGNREKARRFNTATAS